MDKILDFIAAIAEFGRRVLVLYHPVTLREKGISWSIGLIIVTLSVIFSILAQIWSQEPDHFDVTANAASHAAVAPEKLVVGYRTAATLQQVANILLTKPGGYLSNDVMPPTVFLDNMPNWEYGVLVQVRDLARALRNDMGRSQTQSTENKHLAEAEPKFNFSNDAWLFPASETEYQSGIDHLDQYLLQLRDTNQTQTQFFARSDNLREWLSLVEKRLGSLSQRLSASVGQERINTDLAGDSNAKQATQSAQSQMVKTPWLEIDDVFFEARGSVFALVHFLKAVEIDFHEVLIKKNAVVSIRQIIRELEATQGTIWSPIVMNGSGFGITANYSLVMASYISRANAAVIDLRSLLTSG